MTGSFMEDRNTPVTRLLWDFFFLGTEISFMLLSLRGANQIQKKWRQNKLEDTGVFMVRI